MVEIEWICGGYVIVNNQPNGGSNAHQYRKKVYHGFKFYDFCRRIAEGNKCILFSFPVFLWY